MNDSSIALTVNSQTEGIRASGSSHHWLSWPSNWFYTKKPHKVFNLFHPTKIEVINQNSERYTYHSRKHRKQNYTKGEGIKPRSKSILFSWHPHRFSWWTALTFTIGSVVFVIVSIAFLVPSVINNQKLCIAYGEFALLGAILFVFGGNSQLCEVIQSPIEFFDHTEDVNREDKRYLEYKHFDHKNGFDVLFYRSSSLKVKLAVLFGQWYRIDFTLAWIQFIGTLLFVINSVGTTGLFPAAEDPNSFSTFILVTVAPDIIASITFVVAGWLQLVESGHIWWGGFKPFDLGWNIGFYNMLGGIGFLVNAILFYAYQGALSTNLALLIGSIFFLVGSYLAWVEQCKLT